MKTYSHSKDLEDMGGEDGEREGGKERALTMQECIGKKRCGIFCVVFPS